MPIILNTISVEKTEKRWDKVVDTVFYGLLHFRYTDVLPQGHREDITVVTWKSVHFQNIPRNLLITQQESIVAVLPKTTHIMEIQELSVWQKEVRTICRWGRHFIMN